MTERVKRPLAACLCCLLALATLVSLTYGEGSLGRLDARILTRLYGYRHTAAESIAHLFYDLASPLPQMVLLALACAIALRRGLPARAIAAALLVLGANLTSQLLKLLLSHPRYQPLLGSWQINPASFPSGHSTAAIAMTLAYLLVSPPGWRRWLLLLGGVSSLAVGCSVVALHYHYPSDVVGGWLVAAAWFFAIVACLRAFPGPTSARA
jgi:membrane-associated phospholipid phosphatase